MNIRQEHMPSDSSHRTLPFLFAHTRCNKKVEVRINYFLFDGARSSHGSCATWQFLAALHCPTYLSASSSHPVTHIDVVAEQLIIDESAAVFRLHVCVHASILREFHFVVRTLFISIGTEHRSVGKELYYAWTREWKHTIQ